MGPGSGGASSDGSPGPFALEGEPFQLRVLIHGVPAALPAHAALLHAAGGSRGGAEIGHVVDMDHAGPDLHAKLYSQVQIVSQQRRRQAELDPGKGIEGLSNSSSAGFNRLRINRVHPSMMRAKDKCIFRDKTTYLALPNKAVSLFHSASKISICM